MKGSGGLSYLGRELKQRAVEPPRHFTFWVYFLIGAVGFGGFGVWFEVIKLLVGAPGASADSLHTALLTFFTALAGSSALQLVFAADQRPLKSFAIAFCVLFIFLAIWQSLFKPSDPFWAFSGTVLGSVLALAMWWLTSGQDEAFKDNVDDMSAVGGSTDAQPKGNLEGFKL